MIEAAFQFLATSLVEHLHEKIFDAGEVIDEIAIADFMLLDDFCQRPL